MQKKIESKIEKLNQELLDAETKQRIADAELSLIRNEINVLTELIDES